jgi:hypothetical protein
MSLTVRTGGVQNSSFSVICPGPPFGLKSAISIVGLATKLLRIGSCNVESAVGGTQPCHLFSQQFAKGSKSVLRVPRRRISPAHFCITTVGTYSSTPSIPDYAQSPLLGPGAKGAQELKGCQEKNESVSRCGEVRRGAARCGVAIWDAPARSVYFFRTMLCGM